MDRVDAIPPLPHVPETFEQRRMRQILEIKTRLASLSPQLESVPRRQLSNQEGSFWAESLGYFDVLIDWRAIDTILEVCGFPPSQARNEVLWSFRAAGLGERNINGQALSGYSGYWGDKQVIEVYTSVVNYIDLPAKNSEYGLKKFSMTHYALTQKEVACSVLEELRHVIQKKLKLFDFSVGSFNTAIAGNTTAYRAIDYEHEAQGFVDQLLELFIPFVQLKAYDVPQEIYDVADEYRQEFPLGFKNIINPDLIAHFRIDEPAGFLLVEKLKDLSIQELSGDHGLQIIDAFLEKTYDALNDRSIGFVEARWLTEQLRVKIEKMVVFVLANARTASPISMDSSREFATKAHRLIQNIIEKTAVLYPPTASMTQ